VYEDISNALAQLAAYTQETALLQTALASINSGQGAYLTVGTSDTSVASLPAAVASQAITDEIARITALMLVVQSPLDAATSLVQAATAATAATAKVG
jgi:hypothetical protein